MRSVLVTGASTGIGREAALRLERGGWRVFAGVRRAQDGEALRRDASERLEPVILDVTDPATIAAAAKQVEGVVGAYGLDGLVNNAGVVAGGPLEFVELDELRRGLEVNTLGPVAVTQALLPLLRRARGRIVNVGSLSGYFASPFVGPYCASKFALEALSDALRRELRPWGIAVSLVEPGNVATPIWGKGREQIDDASARLPEEARALYGESVEKMREYVQQGEKRAIPADRVARAIERALTARRPRTRYRVGPDAHAVWWLTRLLPDRALDRLTDRLFNKGV
jgi:NAD(P)-dependent dehydrogenase (short-subunit alcohol dehydrogenase family)